MPSASRTGSLLGGSWVVISRAYGVPLKGSTGCFRVEGLGVVISGIVSRETIVATHNPTYNYP